MREQVCRGCGQIIDPADVNVLTDVSYCRSCGFSGHAADHLDRERVERLLKTPPVGCEIIASDVHTSFRAPLRSGKQIAIYTCVCAFVGAVLTPFLVFVVSDLYLTFVGPLPSWCPSSLSQKNAAFSGIFGIIVGILMIPFLGVWLWMFLSLLAHAFGRIEIRLTPKLGSIRMGIGAFNWTRRFPPSDVTQVAIVRNLRHDNPAMGIALMLRTRVRWFGTTLTDDRRIWLATVLRNAILPQGTALVRFDES